MIKRQRKISPEFAESSHLNALKANWVNRIREADPNADCWVQLPKLFLKQFDINCLDIRFNFNDTVFFPTIERFYNEMVKCYNKVFVNDKDTFVRKKLTQPLWGSKFITDFAKQKNSVLFSETGSGLGFELWEIWRSETVFLMHIM